MKYWLAGLMLTLGACGEAAVKTITPESGKFVDLSKRAKPVAITQNPWRDVVINVTDFKHATGLFVDIGGFEIRSQSASSMVIAAPGSTGGYVHLKRVPEGSLPARPASSTAWDKGCFFSLMMRAKNLEDIIDDALPMGWQPHTEMAYLEFGPSKLHIVVLTHESGIRVQLYERLTTPVPEAFPPFERLSRPFNIMQMVEDRDISYDFFQQKLGFDTFFYGKPYVSETEEIMPLGIPKALTTTIPYKTGIMTPKAGLEWGRVEMIDIENMPGGVDFSARCNAGHTGIIAVRFPVEDLAAVRKDLRARDVDFTATENSISVKTPDGSNLEFFQE